MFPIEELDELANAGLLTAALPVNLGGAGLGLDPGLRAALLNVLKDVGYRNLPLGRVFEGHVNALLLLHTFGAPEQLAAAAFDVADRKHVFGVWNTGPPGSPLLTPLPGGCYQLCGSKTFATGAARIQKAFVTASQSDGGWQMCRVPLNSTALKIRRESWNPLGMEASESFTVEFSNLLLPPDALIGKPGDYYAEPAFTSGAFRFCAVQLGGVQALYDSCCDFICAAKRTEDPFQLQRLGQMAVLIESGRQWLAQAGEWLEASFSNSTDLAMQANMMRIAVEEICTRVIQLVQLTVGARGLASSEPFARTLRDLQMYLRQAGYDQAFQVVARQVVQKCGAVRDHA